MKIDLKDIKSNPYTVGSTSPDVVYSFNPS